ncbi:nitrile hydratase beta subunit [Streptomyces sp. V4I23]|uniref:nitrile hydratase subunit beta n=1 Tax=Streptomyces sp. V4I23 TaxID=3042282 RepID=UPI002781D5DD|nr:nitrile hydratase subunit beta [Streptomyces sp. V4I23]MDQ1012147.1 nitrile hydratase beta subunit [Streptomyces sp. V4I23]
MDGVHDLGGMQGFGEVPHTVNADTGGPFHAEWEHLPYSLMFLGAADMNKFSIDEVRHVVERMEPRHYMATPYYERYVIGVATLMVEKGVLTHDELEELAGGPFPLSLPATSAGRPAATERQQFEVGDQVRVRDEYVPGHIRMPRFCRGKTGTITHRTSESWPFPDSIGHGRTDASAEPTYHVSFAATDLWGDDTDAGKVIVDLFEGYLDKV